MERRMRWKAHVRCGVGEKAEITSKPYLSLCNAKKCPKDFGFYEQGYYERTYTVTYIAKHYKVSRPTVYKWLRESKEARKGKKNDV